MTPAGIHQFQIRTHAATRAKGRRDRVWTIDAHTADDAVDKAVTDHLFVAGCRGSYFTGDVSARVELVDGQPPRDCQHMASDPFQAFVPRWDGGRDCQACATTMAVAR